MKFVDQLLERKEISWAIKNQNTSLNIRKPELANIKPLFMLGPRDGHAVHWVVEVAPETLVKLEGKTAFLGLTKCKMKIYDQNYPVLQLSGLRPHG